MRAYAATSSAAFFAIVSSIFSPPPATGCAAPMCVPGAIAATSAAIVRMKPADAARAPAGPTKIATGVLAAIIRVTMVRVESTRPPGVRSVKTTSAAPARSARSIVSIMYSAETGWMMLSTSAEYTTRPSEGKGGASRDGAIVSPEPRVNAIEAASLRVDRTTMVSQSVETSL